MTSRVLYTIQLKSNQSPSKKKQLPSMLADRLSQLLYNQHMFAAVYKKRRYKKVDITAKEFQHSKILPDIDIEILKQKIKNFRSETI